MFTARPLSRASVEPWGSHRGAESSEAHELRFAASQLFGRVVFLQMGVFSDAAAPVSSDPLPPSGQVSSKALLGRSRSVK